MSPAATITGSILGGGSVCAGVVPGEVEANSGPNPCPGLHEERNQKIARQAQVEDSLKRCTAELNLRDIRARVSLIIGIMEC